MSSPTTRTLAYFRKQGYTCQVVERWNAYARVRVDLFGCIDIICVKPGEILGVQATSSDNVNARIVKSLSLPGLRAWLEGGGTFLVVGWAKRGKKGQRKAWTIRQVELTLASLEDE